MNITNKEVINRFAPNLELDIYGKALGAIGLPGDSSPTSRFVKATFLLNNIRFNNDLFITNSYADWGNDQFVASNSDRIFVLDTEKYYFNA